MADLLTCDGNGEIEVDDIVSAINKLLVDCETITACCEKYSVGDVIRIHKVDNVMYMTNDGSDPTP